MATSDQQNHTFYEILWLFSSPHPNSTLRPWVIAGENGWLLTNMVTIGFDPSLYWWLYNVIYPYIYIYTVYPTIEDRIRMYAILCWHYPSCLLLPSCDLYWCLRGSNKWLHVWCHETEHTQRYPTVPNNQALTNTHKNTRKTAKENSWLLEPEKIFSNWGEY